MKAEMKGVVCRDFDTVEVEFGRVQAYFNFSARGKVARKLKLEDGDKVLITIEKI